MRRRRKHLEVSTFPFLAVLLCTMGSLILVLLIMDRKAKAGARAKAIAAAAGIADDAAREAAVRRAELEKRMQEAKLEWEKKRDALHTKLLSEQQALQLQMQQLRDKMLLAAARLRADQEQAGELKKQVDTDRGKVQGETAALATTRQSLAETEKRTEQEKAALTRMTNDLVVLERALKDLKEAREREKQTYSVVPYNGKRGESRRPLYIECAGANVIFHPDKKSLFMLLQRGEVLAEVERRVARQQRQIAPNKLPADQSPYLMLMVRPDGIDTYYSFQRLMAGYDVKFGYELIDGDWILEFPPDDEQPADQPWRAVAMRPNPTPADAAGPSTGNVRGVRLGNGFGNSGGEGAVGPPGSSGGRTGSGTGKPVPPGGIAGPTAPGGGAGAPTTGPGGTSARPTGEGTAMASGPSGGGWNPRGDKPVPPFSASASGANGGTPGQSGGPASTGDKLASSGSNSGAWVPHSDNPLSPIFPTPPATGGSPGGGKQNGGNKSDDVGPVLPWEVLATGVPPSRPRGYRGGNPDSRSGSSPTPEQSGMLPVANPPGTATADGAAGARADAPEGSPQSGQGRIAALPPPDANPGNAGPKTSIPPGVVPSSGAARGTVQPGEDGPSPGGSGRGGEPRLGAPTSESVEGSAEPGSGAQSVLRPLPTPGPQPKRPPSLRSTRLSGDRDYIIFIECRPDGVVLYPAEKQYPLTALAQTVNNPLVQGVQQMIERRQSLVRPGELPYRPQVRFLVRPEGLRTYHLTYPLFDSLPIAKTRQTLIPEDDVLSIVTGN
jgi:hypothetical protein